MVGWRDHVYAPVLDHWRRDPAALEQLRRLSKTRANARFLLAVLEHLEVRGDADLSAPEPPSGGRVLTEVSNADGFAVHVVGDDVWISDGGRLGRLAGDAIDWNMRHGLLPNDAIEGIFGDRSGLFIYARSGTGYGYGHGPQFFRQDPALKRWRGLGIVGDGKTYYTIHRWSEGRYLVVAASRRACRDDGPSRSSSSARG